MRLCGFISRFQLLFPSTGQVAHALLTRPPLSYTSRRIIQHNSVRLACVKHAASVHPEPGSNSHVLIFGRMSCSLTLPFFTVFLRFVHSNGISLRRLSSPLPHALRNFEIILLLNCQCAALFAPTRLIYYSVPGLSTPLFCFFIRAIAAVYKTLLLLNRHRPFSKSAGEGGI